MCELVEWRKDELGKSEWILGMLPNFQYCNNLVDPASSHTLVSKIKPCMCKYK